MNKLCQTVVAMLVTQPVFVFVIISDKLMTKHMLNCNWCAANQLQVVSGKNQSLEKKHSRSFSNLSDPSTPRNNVNIIEDSRNNSLLYTHVISFTLFELETITKSFRSDYILGEGGFGTVYKGYIDENVRVGLKSLPVAVKVLNKEGLQGHREWLVSYHLYLCSKLTFGFLFCCLFYYST